MLPTHIWPDTTRINAAGHLVIGGCDCVALAKQMGTPLYMLCETTLRATMRAYRAALEAAYPHTCSVHYASKALLNTALAQIVAQEGLGLDVVSGGELFVARQARFPLERVHLHGNAKTRPELERALDWGVGAIVVDNLDELALLSHLTTQRIRPQPILLRLAPGIDAHTHAHIATGGSDSKFGLPLDAIDAAAALATRSPGLKLIGLHAHIGSQIFDFASLVRNVAVLLECAAQLRTRYGFAVEEISPGGGLGVAYLPDQDPGDIVAYAQALAAAMQAGCARHNLLPPRLTIEPGRSIVARAGVAIYRVVARKHGIENAELRMPNVASPPSQADRPIPNSQFPILNYLHVDGGMADNIRPALYEARYTALLANRAAEPASTKVHVAGRYCESGDVLLRAAALPPAGPGDLLALAVTGAYTLSMASTYNLVPRPALALVGEGNARLIQRRETEADLVARDLPL